MSEQIETKKVKFNYTVKLTDGTVIETTVNNEPLTIELGKSQILPVIEESFVDKSNGDKFTLNVDKNDAYGDVIQELIEKVELDKLPKEVTVGSELRGLTPDNTEFIAYVEQIDAVENTALINANHPLAGKDLVFEIEIVETI